MTAPTPMSDARLDDLERLSTDQPFAMSEDVKELVAEVQRGRERVESLGKLAHVSNSAHMRLIDALIEALGLDPDDDEACVDGCVEPGGSEHMLWHLVQQRDQTRARVAELEAEVVSRRRVISMADRAALEIKDDRDRLQDRVLAVQAELDRMSDQRADGVRLDSDAVIGMIRRALDGGAP